MMVTMTEPDSRLGLAAMADMDTSSCWRPPQRDHPWIKAWRVSRHAAHIPGMDGNSPALQHPRDAAPGSTAEHRPLWITGTRNDVRRNGIAPGSGPWSSYMLAHVRSGERVGANAGTCAAQARTCA